MAFTFFFRDLQTLEYVVDELIPRVAGRSKIKIWDAGCASGEEPFTLAILLAEKMGQFSFKNIEIHATDIDISNQFGEIILNGIYPYDILQRIPKPLFEKYFDKIDDKNYQINYKIRSKIIFKREDLTQLKPSDNDFSLIICKNVLLHLSPAQREEVISMFHKSLMPNGILATEQTQKMPDKLSDKFVPISTHAQIFEKR
ncbi:MAG: CheR family methyltransferase [Bacteroidota bacterium]